MSQNSRKHEEERAWLLADTGGQPSLLLRCRPGPGPSVVYVHGSTFPSALSLAYRFPGGSWMDHLAGRGFDVWGFDFPGYGGSERPRSFAEPAEANPPYGRARTAVEALARVVEEVLRARGPAKVSLLAHSWGTFVAGLYANHRPERIERIALFGPIAERRSSPPQDRMPAWHLISLDAQLSRFRSDVPPDHPPILIEPDLAAWGPAYLASDPEAVLREPQAVKVPAGPAADVVDAWSGRLPYDPGGITAPTVILRGEWDSVANDADAAWLMSRLGSSQKRDVVLPKLTHLAHLESARLALFEATADFLAA